MNFYQYFSPVAHADLFRINVVTAAMHILPARIIDVNNSFQNKNVPIHKKFCVILPPYYLDWFEISYSPPPPTHPPTRHCVPTGNRGEALVHRQVLPGAGRRGDYLGCGGDNE